MSALAEADRDGGAIPVYLIAHARWLLWRTETRIDRKTGEQRTTKVPISFHTGKPCDVTAPASWIDYDKVKAALARASGAWDGAGFALGLIEAIGEVVIGLDSDTCLDEDGSPAAWAVPFLDAWGSYAEVSPGGVGIKGIARIRLADLPEARRLLDIAEGDREQARTRVFGERIAGRHAPSAQLFLMARYFTVTGRHWVHSPEDVTLLSLEQIAQLAALFGPKQRRADGAHRDAGAEDDDTAPDETELRDKLQAAFVRNPRLKERWEGGTQSLSDTTRSGRDMSVLAMLVSAGFTKGETRAALCWFEHGKVKDETPRYAHKGGGGVAHPVRRQHAKPYSLGNAFLDVQDVQVVQRPGFVLPRYPQSAPGARAAVGNGGGARHAIRRAGGACNAIHRSTWASVTCGSCERDNVTWEQRENDELGERMSTTADDQRREHGRERSEAFRERRRYGRLLVQVEVGPRHLAALERLALLGTNERDKACIAWAVSRFLDAAPHVSALGDVLWPAEEEESDDA